MDTATHFRIAGQRASWVDTATAAREEGEIIVPSITVRVEAGKAWGP
jgi:hypothetical protein